MYRFTVVLYLYLLICAVDSLTSTQNESTYRIIKDLATILEDVKMSSFRLGVMQETQENMQDGISTLKSEVENLQGKCNDFDTDSGDMEIGLYSRVDAQDVDIQQINSRIDNLDSRINGLSADIRDMEALAQSRAIRLEEKMAKVYHAVLAPGR